MSIFCRRRTGGFEVVVQIVTVEVLVEAQEHTVAPIGGKAPVVCTYPCHPTRHCRVRGDPHFEDHNHLTCFDDADHLAVGALRVNPQGYKVRVVDVKGAGGVHYEPFEGGDCVQFDEGHGCWQ